LRNRCSSYESNGDGTMTCCVECGAMFQQNSAPQKYCLSCRQKTCPVCRGTFAPKNGNHRQVCCSLKCAAHLDPVRTERINAHRGTKPRTYHLRHRDKHGCAADRDWREQVFKRDEYICQHCGTTGGKLQAHHIKSYKGHPELRHDVANGLTLCLGCHSKTNTFGWANYWRTEIAAKRMAQAVLL
jgi:5-methylcytosine-specific restriction endonuclease McrA